MSELLVNTIKKADGTGSLSVPAESGTVVTTASPSLGRRNLIINGAMQVAQRSTSETGVTSNNYHTLDRYRLTASGATYSTSQQSLTAGQTDIPSQFKYFQRFNPTTANNNCGVAHRIEDVTAVSGETVTFSLYAKGTNPAGGELDVRLSQNFGSGGSTEVNTTVGTLTLTSSWQRFTYIVSVPSISGKTVGTNSYLELKIFQPDDDTGTSAFTFDSTGWQLEVGTVATPFEHRSYGEELALCERYYQSWGGGNAYEYLPLFGGAVSGTRIEAVMQYKRDMRTPPTISYSGNWQWLDGVSTFTFVNILKDSIAINSVRISDNGISGVSQYRFYLARANNDSTARFKMDAEL